MGSFQHVIPNVGLQTITLFPPADRLYDVLQAHNEIRRLNKLRHLGALSRTFPGTRHARWDYSAAILHFIAGLKPLGLASAFTVGNTRFSSKIAALQCAALAWNIGHVPGTFAVEKGIYRFLYSRSKKELVDGLDWPDKESESTRHIVRRANDFVLKHDYLGVARALAVLKLMHMTAAGDPADRQLVLDFLAPFLLDYDLPTSQQWARLRRAFKLARHLAYLTIDAPVSGLQWTPNVSSLFEHQIDAHPSTSLEDVSAVLSEVLSPVERLVFNALYHKPEARRETEAIASHVAHHLRRPGNAEERIADWLTKGLIQQLRLGELPHGEHIYPIGSATFRSHFLLAGPPIRVEVDAAPRLCDYFIALRYNAWNADVLLEPDEFVVSAFAGRPARPSDVGRFLRWVIETFDARRSPRDEVLENFSRAELGKIYVELLGNAVSCWNPALTLKVEPWRLREYGIDHDAIIEDRPGGIWASAADLNDSLLKHVFRDRYRSIPPELREQYAELTGLRALRNRFRADGRTSRARCRWLVVAGSVRFCSNERELIEFDGGLVKLSLRSGRLHWYGIETKSSGRGAVRSLKKRLAALKIQAPVRRLGVKSAYVEIELGD